jgi:hypothetical protein
MVDEVINEKRHHFPRASGQVLSGVVVGGFSHGYAARYEEKSRRTCRVSTVVALRRNLD